MKPAVRQVDGEWRVWWSVGEDRDGRTIHVGDQVVTTETLVDDQDEGRIPPGLYTVVVESGAVYGDRPGAYLSGYMLDRSVAVESPGIPCEVELPPGMRQGKYVTVEER